MARSASQIQADLIRSVNNTNRRIDTAKGPVFDVLLQPVPIELAVVEAEQERLNLMTTLRFGDVATLEEAQALLTAFSLPPGNGEPARGTVWFLIAARPTQDIPIERGSLVGTSDGSFQFFVTRRVVLPALQADLFFNAESRLYEISAPIEAVAVGPDYDLAPETITEIITPISGVDEVVNRDATEGGVLVEDPADSTQRISAKLGGLNPDSAGGVISSVRDFDPANVLDVSIVYPKDRPLFTRVTNRPAQDVYVIGQNAETKTQSLTAVGGETEIVLDEPPVTGVTAVTVNGNQVTFAFLQDTSRDFGLSPQATDKVALASALAPGDVVFIQYSTNQLIRDLSTEVFDPDDGRPFDTSVIPKQARQVAVSVSLSAVVLPSFDPTRTETAIITELTDIVQPLEFIDLLQPNAVREQLIDRVAGISNLNIRIFRRVEQSLLAIETITFEKNEESILDQATLVVDVSR